MTVYLDTSFLLPYYLDEPTSQAVQAVLRSAPAGTIMTSAWTLVEFNSALARLKRMGLLETDPSLITHVLDEHVRDVYTVLEHTLHDFLEARTLLLRDPSLGLRGPDALHLAAAKRHDLTLYSLDVRLLDCAASLGVEATDGGVRQGRS